VLLRNLYLQYNVSLEKRPKVDSAFLFLRGRQIEYWPVCRVHCIGWQVTLCDFIWQVTLRKDRIFKYFIWSDAAVRKAIRHTQTSPVNGN